MWLRLRARSDFTPEHDASRITCLEKRLDQLAAREDADADAIRLADRLTRHRNHRLTFLPKPEVPADNNFDERQLRPAVLIRKISQGNRCGFRKNPLFDDSTLSSASSPLKKSP